MKLIQAGLVFFIGFMGCPSVADDKPNILWLTAEDMSPNLGCYGDVDAMTPRLDDLARQSVRYENAFATAPVCSPSRSCLITGVYATSLGTQRLRSEFPIPQNFQPFTAYLRSQGWYCTNNAKTDYNLRDEAGFVEAAWDTSSPTAHWRSRLDGQPFFAVFNFMTTHQSRTSAWSHAAFEAEVGSQLSMSQRHDPTQLSLPPYYPDTAEARRAWARYHDCITRLDDQVGTVLDQLQADGLADNTIVFFYSDHGMGMPRGKRCLQDSGLRVPLLIRFPKKWEHLAPSLPGTATERLVSFVDFAPTVLSLCGLESPSHFQGVAFAGPKAGPPRALVFGARDRVDEAFDVARSVHDGRWLYIRNFMPHLPWMQAEAYSDTSTFRKELKQLASSNQLNPIASMYAAAPRALEELYDRRLDPHQTVNLATFVEHQATLASMRTALHRWQLETRDTGFLTEPQMWSRLDQIGQGEKHGKPSTPWEVARHEDRYRLSRLLEVASAVGRSDMASEQLRWLAEPDDAVRYWAAVGFRARRTLEPLEDTVGRGLLNALDDDSAVVRIESASALAAHGEPTSAIPVLVAALHDSSPEVVLHAARALELLGPMAAPARSEMQAVLTKAREAEAAGDAISMFIRFSLEAALE